ncbi:DNA polymerase delta small subunit-like protein [Elsinoe fawcettii]|nr:DNA polymerase delta small subunit-like protein [Elsinoe fawcettii]
MAPISSSETLLQPPTSTPPPIPQRNPSLYLPLTTFSLPTTTRTYTQQFSDLYFSRLALLKPPTSTLASSAWSTFRLGSTQAQRVDRVLDVRQGDLCYVVGTVFLEMPLKPNVLEDVGREEWISAPVNGAGKFFAEEEGEEGMNGTGKGGGTKGGWGERKVMLEDESGRLRLTGDVLERVMLVTGAIIAVLGTENRDGEFEVLDVKVPDLPRQPVRGERGEAEKVVDGRDVGDGQKGGKIALVSGLGITGEEGDMLALEVLGEYLLGEAGGEEDIQEAARVSRLMVLGNSLAGGGPIPSRDELANKKHGQRKYGYDSSAYNSGPTDMLDNWLAGLLPSIPITLLPGDSDPTQAALPQQPIHAALFPRSRAYMPPPLPPGAKKGEKESVGWFHSVTNPWDGDVDGWRMLATGGQPVEDMCRYLRGDDRVEIMESTLRWRILAPTAPDTLWCYPFQDGDAFVLKNCPHIYIAGNQPRFETDVVEGPNGQAVRLIAVPKFKGTGEIILLDTETLEPEVVKFEVFGAE